MQYTCSAKQWPYENCCEGLGDEEDNKVLMFL